MLIPLATAIPLTQDNVSLGNIKVRYKIVDDRNGSKEQP